MIQYHHYSVMFQRWLGDTKKARQSGENYNVFWILNLSSAEVRTHSAFLADLLNPQGWHEQKETFLELFINQLSGILKNRDTQTENPHVSKVAFEDFDVRNAVARKEITIGKISEDKTDGGRIDICIKDTTGKAIIIENKIYAVDGENQLQRYHNYAKEKHPNKFILLYLTLFGDEPSSYSKGSLEKEDYFCISYHTFIREWLEKCENKAANHMLLKSTITQYINLIKYLTHQTINEDMAKEIAEIINGKTENLKAAFAIQQSMPQVRQQIILKLNESLNQWAEKNSLKLSGALTHKEYSKIWLCKDHWQSKICLSFYKSDFSEFRIGVGKGFDEQDEHDKVFLEREFLRTSVIRLISHPMITPIKQLTSGLGSSMMKK